MSTRGYDVSAGKFQFGELKSRLIFVLGAFVVYRIGAHIPVPGIDPNALAAMFEQQSGSMMDMFNMFSGGALMRLSIFALGIMPYISASIIMQLMTIVIPAMEQLKKKENQVVVKFLNILAMARLYWRCFSQLVSL